MTAPGNDGFGKKQLREMTALLRKYRGSRSVTGLRASTVGYCLSGTDRRANADAESIG